MAEPLQVATIVEALLVRAHRTPDALAYAVEGNAITYRALCEDVLRVAGVLGDRGLTRGTRCALILPSGLDLIRAVYATQALAAAPVALSPTLPPDMLLRRLRLVGADLAIARREALPALCGSADHARQCRIETVEDIVYAAAHAKPALVMPGPDDPAFLQVTSGTTGEPRAAVIRHRSLQASLRASRDRLDIRPDDVLATWVPLHHDLGLVRFVFGALYFGCPSHLVQPSMANLGRWLKTISRVRATITGSPDFGYRFAARSVDPRGLDLSSLRFATNGGEPVRWSTIEQFERRFGLAGVVRPAYGLAEATLGVTSLAPGEPLRTDAAGHVSCGRPYSGTEVRIAGSDGRELSSGTPGEILVRGDAVFAGYFEDEPSTREVLRDGWLHTGDVGTVDEVGHLFVRGRARALIKRAGVPIAPREIEEAVDRVNGVRFSAAVGVSRDSIGSTESVVVVTEIRPEAAPSRIARTLLAERIEREVIGVIGVTPGQILLVSPRTIPRTSNGKIRYDELRQLVAEDALSRRGSILFRS